MIGHRRQQTPPTKRHGFTIVELLIVIIVIAILAAIVIVAYNGITTRANASAAQSAANDLAKLLANSYITNNSYPNDLSTINNGGPMPNTGGTTYAYHPGSGNSSYCATITTGKSSYKITDTATVPVSGGCAGDGVGGVAAITNMSTNPSFETDLSTYGVNCVGGTANFILNTSGAYSGNNYGHLTASSCSNANVGVYEYNLPVTQSTTYTGSAYVRANPTKNISIGLEWHTATSFISVNFGSNSTVGSSGWTRLSSSAQAPAGATSVTLVIYTTNGSTINTGDTMDIDGVMLTQGSTLYNYADGNSPNWIWNGNANSSTSTGPPQ